MAIIIASISSNLSVPEAVMQYHLLNIKYWLHTSLSTHSVTFVFWFVFFSFSILLFLNNFYLCFVWPVSSFCCEFLSLLNITDLFVTVRYYLALFQLRANWINQIVMFLKILLHLKSMKRLKVTKQKKLLYSKFEKLWHINIAYDDCLNILT